MKKCSIAINSNVNVASAFVNSAKMSEKVSNVNTVSIRAEQTGEGIERPGLRQQTTCNQVPREGSNSTVLTSSVTSHSHRRQWSVDFCKYQAPPVIMVRKNKKEPEPPQRATSLQQLQRSSHSSLKRYSCPPIGIFMSTSSSSSSTPTSPCCSPTSVPTSVIIGPDPLGWKMQPISRSRSSQARAKRLSLQIPLPAVPTSSSLKPEPSSQTKPALRPKPFRRHHSESSAFLNSLEKTLPVVTLEHLHAVHLQPVSLSDGSDNVFDESTQGQESVCASPPKIPPPVPEKTAMTRRKAYLIACSQQCCKPVRANINSINATKPMSKHWHQNMGYVTICKTKMAELHPNNVCNRNR
ncbi:hypothetical protein XENORESO_015273 [Xenotaenia resolanae]|uniref:Uncharacterized protein n=1 Tax=Xenotaenia resolanae TaxID=208358 RepID=A0ABV0W3M9_9TELE